MESGLFNKTKEFFKREKVFYGLEESDEAKATRKEIEKFLTTDARYCEYIIELEDERLRALYAEHIEEIKAGGELDKKLKDNVQRLNVSAADRDLKELLTTTTRHSEGVIEYLERNVRTQQAKYKKPVEKGGELDNEINDSIAWLTSHYTGQFANPKFAATVRMARYQIKQSSQNTYG